MVAVSREEVFADPQCTNTNPEDVVIVVGWGLVTSSERGQLWLATYNFSPLSLKIFRTMTTSNGEGYSKKSSTPLQ